MQFDNPSALNAWIAKLETASGLSVGDSWANYRSALQNRHDFFAQHGSKLSDHGNDTFYAEDYTDAEIQAAFAKARQGSAPTPSETAKLKSAFMELRG